MESSAATVRAPAALRLSRVRPELLALIGLAALLNLWALGQNGWANEYYSAAVKSMSSSWHAFLYDSFDKSGVMTVDKPPLALWVQVASVKLFGFSSLSMLIPQALMGAASVGLVYDLTRRVFGRPAGFVAGLALATTPVMVAVSRHNNPDALLVLCSVAALWAMVRAFEDGRTRWLVVAGICIGLGFETKMAVALMVVPALAAAWLWVAPRGRTAALRQLLAGGAAMLVVGAAWPLLMLLTPAADRPWVSGTADNSVLSLIFGYNGFSRIAGQAGGPGSFGANTMFGGPNGPLRLVEASLGGQAGWLLGFAIAGGVGLVVATRLRRGDARTGWLVATGGSFLTIAVAFSAAKGIFHPYYVSLLAPFAAALVGATTGHLLEGGRAARLLAPLAVLGGVATELAVLNDYPGDLTWLRPLLVVLGLAAAGALAVTGLERHRKTVLAAAVTLLLVAPAIWSAQTLGHPANGTFPSGGPSSARMLAAGPGGPGGGPPGGMQAGGPPGFGGRSQQLASVLRYTRAHGGGTVAVSSQQGASAQIIGSGSDVAALGGFSGRESEVSVKWFADAVRAGKIRWVLTDGAGSFGPDNRVGSSKLMAAVQRTCKQVSTGLYDCGGYADALAAEAS